MKNNYLQNSCLPFQKKILSLSFSATLKRILHFLFLFLLLHVKIFAQDVDYEIVDVEDELKKVCWPVISTSKTQSTTNKMKTDTASSPTPMTGGLATPRKLYNAIEVPNTLPNPATIQIFDLLGNQLIINGTPITLLTSPVSGALAASSIGTTPGFHWVGYESNTFQPDNIATYYYNIFHRWFGGMPCHYESYGGRQWNSDNSGFADYSDTVFVPHPVLASIVQPVSCYGSNNGIIKVNTNPLNYYTFSINSSTATTNNTFSSLSAGIYTIHITDSFANSCDTVITLTQPPSLGSSYTVSNCGAYTWPVNGATYTNSGSYFFISTTSTCPKKDTLFLTVTSNATASSNITAYNFYTWPVNGQTYTASGNYFNSSTTAPGCQTFSVLNLNIIYTPYNMNLIIDQEISCHGNNDGSIQATVFPSTATNIIYQLNGGTQFNNTGFFAGLAPGTHTVCAISGSVSVCKTITLINPPLLAANIITDSLVSCMGNDGGLSGNVTGGTAPYTTYWTNAANIILTYGDDITGIGPGLYRFHVEDDRGCILVVNKVLTASPQLTVNVTYTPVNCNGGTTALIPSSAGGTGNVAFTIFGSPLISAYPAGTYTVTATDAQGCVATKSVTITQPPMEIYMTDAVSCNSYYWSINALTYTTSGTYYAFLNTVSGCLIINVLNLTINSNSTSSSTIAACNSYTWNASGITYTSSGVYTKTSLNSTGCLHTATLNLTINYSTTGTKTATACDTYTWTAPGASNPYTASGTYTATSLNTAGCVHTETLFLTINHSSSSTSTVTACNTYTWSANGTTYTNSGTYTQTTVNAQGCVHSNILVLTINHTTTSSTNITACNSYTWSVNNVSYTTSGTYTATSINTQNCLHTAVLVLVIKNSSVSTSAVTANNTYTWNANNITYTVSGLYSATLINAAGCDSLLTLNLTINPVASVLNLKCFIEGYWDGNNGMVPVLTNQSRPGPITACDTITVSLHNAAAPYNMIYTTKVVLLRNGNAVCTFPPLSASYYIVVKHRNAVQTWSTVPVYFSATAVNYNFSNALNKAYGNNQIQVKPGTWAFYSGDVDASENIDLFDLNILETGITNYNFGYYATDINGDGNVDLLDFPVVESNLSNFIFSEHP